eukprot:TRINITY_DN2015_c0_g2_i2.p1 TRINITY_DN2015_c0_g2~~TRINITY_DN2015_c0_g2_i2.p1  ORF type:complete len:561 (+),score=123.01 TRINITY_DN2015_c0_g2_i2:383-2065(+)
MRKFGWTLIKTLEYLNSRRPDLEIRASFFHQLTALENRLARVGIGAKSNTWSEFAEDLNDIESEEVLIANTFLNAKNAPFVDFVRETGDWTKAQSRISWVDHGSNDKARLATLFIPYDAVFSGPNKRQRQSRPVRPILKGSAKGKNSNMNSQMKKNSSSKQLELDDAYTSNHSNRHNGATPLRMGSDRQGNGRSGQGNSGVGQYSNARSNSFSRFEESQGQTPAERQTFAEGGANRGNLVSVTVNNFMNSTNFYQSELSNTIRGADTSSSKGTRDSKRTPSIDASDKEGHYYKQLHAEDETNTLLGENPNSLNLVVSKQLKEALERKRAMLSTGNPQSMKENILTSTMKQTFAELDAYKKPVARLENRHDIGTISPKVMRGNDSSSSRREQKSSENKSANNSYNTSMDSVYNKTLKKYGQGNSTITRNDIDLQKSSNQVYSTFLMGGDLRLASTTTAMSNKRPPENDLTQKLLYSKAQNFKDYNRSANKKGPIRAYEMQDRPSSAQQGLISGSAFYGGKSRGILGLREEDFAAARVGRPATAPGFRSFSPGIKPSTTFLS